MVPVILSILVSTGIQAPDTLIVAANNPPVWGDRPELIEELRIGMLEGPEEYTFGRVSGLAIGHQGTVYVGDDQIPTIRQFGPEGRWIRDIGRQGEGPGEYNSGLGMRSLDGQTLAILDPRNSRVTRYRNGTYDFSFPSLSGLFSADLFAIDTAGCSYVKTFVIDPQKPFDPGEEWDMAWIRFDGDGEVLDTLNIPPEDQVGGGFVISGKGGYFRPFSVMTVTALSPRGYLVTARNDEYAVHRPLPDGRVVRIEHHAQSIPVGPEEGRQWEEWVQHFERRSADAGQPREFGPIPDTKPFIRHLFVDDDARIWVAVYAEARFTPYSETEKAERGDRPSLEWNQPLDWDVFDPKGRFLGRITLPDKTSLMAARGTTVWGSQAGAFDEEYVVRFRIQSPGGELQHAFAAGGQGF